MNDQEESRERAPNVTADRLANVIKIVPTVAIGVTSILYATGLLIVTLYLASHGVYFGEFARLDYILVGGAFVLIVAAQALGVYVYLVEFRKARAVWKLNKRSSLLHFLLAIFVLISAPATLANYISGYHLTFTTGRFWFCIGSLILFVFVSWTIVRDTRSYAVSLVQKDGWLVSARGLDQLLYTLSTPCFLLAAITSYSTSIHPLSAFHFGGGEDTIQ